MYDEREERVYIRVTAVEKDYLKKASEILGMDISRFVRNMTIETSKAIVEDPNRNHVLVALSHSTSTVVQHLPDAKPEIEYEVIMRNSRNQD